MFVPAGSAVFDASIICGMERAAAGEVVDLVVAGGSQWRSDQQIAAVEAAIAAGIDALILQPADAQLLVRTVKEALDAGVYVVLVDTRLDRPIDGVASVASDDQGIGREAADTLAAAMEGHGMVLALTRRGATSTADRLQGLEDRLAALRPDIDGVIDVPIPRGRQSAVEKIADALFKYPDVGGIFAAAGGIVVPAALALEKLGIPAMPIVGVDGGPTELEQLAAHGAVQALVSQEPVAMGEAAVRQALAVLDGGSSETEVVTAIGVLTSANADDPRSAPFRDRTTCADVRS
jgi:ribose transport system substrate-binding protein